MEWIHDIKGQQYEQLLKILFAHCDTVQCIVIEDVGDYFEEIAYECLEKKYVTQWPLTSLGHEAVPVLQYTFRCHYNTEQFFRCIQCSLFWMDGIDIKILFMIICLCLPETGEFAGKTQEGRL